MRTLIIGASGEIGGAVARRLRKDNHEVIMHFNTNRSVVTNLADEIGVEDLVEADVCSEDAVSAMLQHVGGRRGLDGLVYAAGINPIATEISQTSLSDWRRTMDVNLKGAFLCVREAIAHMKQSSNASIVLVSSIFGLSSPANRGAYGSSKHALNGLVQSVAREEAPGIRINAVCPGAIWTENVRRIFPQHAASVGISVEDYVKQRTQKIPAGRFLELPELAAMVAYLLSPDAGFVTGESIRIAGGEI